MKYWSTKKSEPDCISLSSPTDLINSHRVVDIGHDGNGAFFIGEGCDEHFTFWYLASEAIEALQEAIDWIKEQQEAK
ncbi:MAG: hypothetical protein E6R03_04110 [Hyphomicrobiaceae bacterium]|nr:MAG: hypothetical protein E6R03_04110 [Hyphomicrobiaceae bacterium]